MRLHLAGQFAPAAEEALLAAGHDLTEANADRKLSLVIMLTGEGVALTPGWFDSKATVLEVEVAKRLGMPVKRWQEWLG